MGRIKWLRRWQAMLTYRMAFSRWLWLYTLVMLTLVLFVVGLVWLHAAEQLVPVSGMVIVLVVVAIIFTISTNTYFRRVTRKIQNFAEAVAAGNFNARLPRRNHNGEIEDILTSLHQMRVQLRNSFAAQASKEASNALLVQAINQSSNSVMVSDTDARILYVNDAFIDTTGYSREEAIGQTPRLIQSGKTAPEVYRVMRKMLESGKTWRGELINQRKDGSEFIETVTISPVRDADGKIYRYMAVKEDITDMRQAQDSIERLAYFDALTDLPNRRYFLDQLNRQIAKSRRAETRFALLFVDLNRFKEINDTHGHVVGDEVLQEIARRFRKVTRSDETLARLGGDEFVLLTPQAEPEVLERIAARLLDTLDDGVRCGSSLFNLGASIGVALYPRHGLNSRDLLRHADIAMYEAKRSVDRVRHYERGMSDSLERDLAVANRLAQALRGDLGLELHIQAQVDLRDSSLTGGEVLLRWNDPQIGQVSPADFIRIAEERGMMAELDRFVLERALQMLADWSGQGCVLPGPLAVNLSMVSFEQDDFVSWLEQRLSVHELPPGMLELELTESGLMRNPERALQIARRLQAQGIRLAIDDFGTGYSSLAYLVQFEAAKVKIDQSFIRHLNDDPRTQTIVKATIRMVDELGMTVLAEGVESEHEIAWLLEHGCIYAQGFAFAKVQSEQDFRQQWLIPQTS